MQIQVSDLHKSFVDGEGRRLHILRRLDFELETGSSASIIGASGTGKSTFLHILGTLDQADSGRIIIEGKKLSEMNREKCSEFRSLQIGFIFQFHQLLQDFSALENVMIPSMIRGQNYSKSKHHAKKLLERVGLGERLGHRPSRLSGGEQQRVAIARALSNAPRLLLADEPTGNLDEETGEQVMDLLLQLNKEDGTTIVIITHNNRLASLTQKQFRLENGQLHPVYLFNQHNS